MLSKAKQIIRAQLVQGLSVSSCQVAIAMALTLGVFPILGCSTPMNMIAGFRFKLNQPIIQFFNYLAAPLKLLLILPFIRLGEWLFQAEPFRLSLTEFSARFFADMTTTSTEFFWTFVHAIIAWCMCAPLIYGCLLILTKPLIKRLSRSLSS